MASADELRAQFSARRDQAMQRLMALGVARSRYMQEQEAKMEAAAKKAEAQRMAAEREGGRNWLNMAGTGAQIGSAGGPWGALIGAGVGAAAGLYGATKSRGGGLGAFGKSLTRPMGDKWDGMQDIPLGGLVTGATLAGKAAGIGQSASTGPYKGSGYHGMATSGPLTETDLMMLENPELAESSSFYGKPSYESAQQGQINSIYSSGSSRPRHQ